MEQGRRAAGMQAKASDKATRAEIRASRTRKQTLKADQIKYRDQIKSNAEFQKGLQKINMQFLQGTLSFKERAASIGRLTKQYRQLNSQAATHNRLSGVKGIVGRVGATAAGTAAVGAGVIGAGGYAAQQGFNSVKSKGQQFEQLDIILNNVFKERAVEISNRIATLANKNGRDILDLGNSLVEFAALMKPLGNTVDDSLTIFQKYQDMIATYGLDKEQSKGFMTQWSQALAQNTLDSYVEAMRQWNPQLKANFETWIKDKKGINDFLDNITGGKKYNLKKMMDEYLTVNSGHYAQGAAGYKKSSMSNDARASNSVSVALYRIFESGGFQRAMESASNIVRYWGNLLETNAGKIGDVFGNLYGITEDLSKQGFQELSDWLKALTKEDIQGYFGDLKNSMMQFADVMRRLFAFLDSVLPKQTISDQKGQYYIQREKYWLDQGYSGQEAGRFADGEMRKQFNLGFTVPTLENSLVRMSARNQTTNHQATLDLKINTEVNQPKLDQYVWATIKENDNRNFNLAFSY